MPAATPGRSVSRCLAAMAILCLSLTVSACSDQGPDRPAESSHSLPETSSPAIPLDPEVPSPATNSPGSPGPTPAPSPSRNSTSGAELPTATPGVSGSPALSRSLGGQQLTAPLIETPLPKASINKGTLGRDFPRFLGPSPRSTVQVASLSPQGLRLQVALSATSPATVDAVLRSFSVRLTRRGMEPRERPTTDGSSAIVYSRGPSSVTVSALRAGDRTEYSVYGVLVADGP